MTHEPQTLRLYLGRSIQRHDGTTGIVTDHAFGQWVADALAPYLHGWTIIEAAGGWNGSAGPVSERSTIVEVFDDGDGDVSTESIVRQAAREYARRFAQDAVGFTASPLRLPPVWITG